VTVYSSNTAAGYRYAQFALLDAAGYAGQTLTFTAKAQQVTGSSTPRILGRLYDSNGSSVGSTIFEKTGTSITHTFTLPATIDSGVTFRVLLYCNSGYAEATETNFYDIQVEVGSTAHDFAPYENICPISGLTGLSVYRSGANLLNSATNITGKYITASGSISNGDDAQYTDLIPVKAGETCLCSFVSGRNKGGNMLHGYDANGGWVKQLAYANAFGKQGTKLVMVATIDSGISYVRLSYGITDTEAMVFAFSQEISWEGYHPVTR